MKKILIVANVISFIEKFNTEIINFLQDKLNCEVHVACNTEYMNDTDRFLMLSFVSELRQKGVVLHHVPILRSPFHTENIAAYYKLKKIINTEDFDIIHCHTPVGAMLTRLAARNVRKNGTKVIYTAHGFHFYKGAPFKNWLLYYPAECLLARWTDVLITINKEDYCRALKLKADKIVYVPGVGIDAAKYSMSITKEHRHGIRTEMGIADDAILICSVGELNCNKNHALVINALACLENKNVHYCIAGEGEYRENLTALAQALGIADRVHILGYRSDVHELYKSSDIFCFPSLREGLPVALMEAMASGLPCVASRIRGNMDLLGKEYDMLFEPNSIADCKTKLEWMIAEYETFCKIDYSEILLPFSKHTVIAQMKELYLIIFENKKQDMREVAEMYRR